MHIRRHHWAMNSTTLGLNANLKQLRIKTQNSLTQSSQNGITMIQMESDRMPLKRALSAFLLIIINGNTNKAKFHFLIDELKPESIENP